MERPHSTSNSRNVHEDFDIQRFPIPKYSVLPRASFMVIFYSCCCFRLMLTFWSPWEGYGSVSAERPADFTLTLGSLALFFQACGERFI